MNLHEFIHSPAVTCSPEASLSDVAEEMARYNVGSVVTVDPDGHVAGIVTDRDLAIRGMAKRLDPDSPVKEIMSTKVVALNENADLFDAASQMAESGCRRLPVVGADGLLKGVISLDDLMIVFARQTDDLAHAVASETTSPLPRT